MEILGKVLGSPARVKVMRLFLLNKGKAFTSKDIVKRSRISSVLVRRELNLLSSISFVRRKASKYSFNPTFKYAYQVEELLVNAETLDKQNIINNLKKTGRLKLLLVSGIFIKDKDSRVDMLLVGDSLKRAKIEEQIRKFEAEIGKELSYTVFNTKEFVYRVSMYDKLVRDILDFPHEILLQAKELSNLEATKRAKPL